MKRDYESGSLFTRDERDIHKAAEPSLIVMAKCGDVNPLLTFWESKRKAFFIRSIERMHDKEIAKVS